MKYGTFVVLSDVLLDNTFGIEGEHVPEVCGSLSEDEDNHAETSSSQADDNYFSDEYLLLLCLLLGSQLFVLVLGGKGVHLCDLVLCCFVLTVDLHYIYIRMMMMDDDQRHSMSM